MSLTSTLTVNGQKHNLVIEWIEAAYTLSIALENAEGQRIQFIRIPLLDFMQEDLCFFAAYLNAFITSLDPQEMWDIHNTEDEDDEGGTVG